MMKRRVWVQVHRYTGLVLALFLILEGLTGSILAFNSAFDRMLNPQWYAQPKPGAVRLSLGELAERANALEPGGMVEYLFANPDQELVMMAPRAGKTLDFDQVFLDPWTGKELGRRRSGYHSPAPSDIMPFVYSLHSQLAAGPTGVTILGVIALIWTIDCFISFYLTLPAALKGFWRRWQLAWKVRWWAGTFRLNFDLHRAGGLWLWPLLLVFAWSSVMFELPDVFDRVTGSLMDYRSATDVVGAAHPHIAAPPRLGWRDAEAAGARLLAQQAAQRGLTIGAPDSLAYIPEVGVYSYSARSNIEVRSERADTGIWFDADTGKLRELFLPVGQHTGNSLYTWLYALHFADVGGSLAYRWFVALAGLIVAMLSVTGVVIWLKKRQVRRRPPTSAP
jgi:uncharacterized iron-regulated membrane protein